MENNFILIIRSKDKIIPDMTNYQSVIERQYCCTVLSNWEQRDKHEIMLRVKATEHCMIEVLKILSWKFPSAGIELFEFVDN